MKTTTENNHNISASLLKDVIYINTASGQGSQTTISVTVVNTGQTDTEVKSIAIVLPTTITTNPNTITPKPTEQWSFAKSSLSGNQFDAIAKAGKVVFRAGDTATFDLEKVKLVNTIEAEFVFITVKIKLNNSEPAFDIPLKVALKSAKCSIDKFSVDKPVIQPGESAELSWDTNKISYCIIEPNIGRKNAKGSFTVSPKISQTYTLWAYEANTLLFAQLTVTVDNVEVKFSSNMGSQLTIGDMVTLKWNCNDIVQNAILSDNKRIIPTPLKFTGNKARANSVEVGPVTELNTFKLLVTRDEVVTKDSQFASATIVVDDVVDVEAAFSATPTTGLWQRDKVMLTWNIKSAATITIEPALPNGPSLQKLSGTLEIHPESDVTYTLTVKGFINNRPETLVKKIVLNVQQVRIHEYRVEEEFRNPSSGYILCWNVNAPVRKISTIGNIAPAGRHDITRPRGTSYTITVGTEQNPAMFSQTASRP